jgi:hypothetical protein
MLQSSPDGSSIRRIEFRWTEEVLKSWNYAREFAGGKSGRVVGKWPVRQAQWMFNLSFSLNERAPSWLHLVRAVEGLMPTSLATRRQWSLKEGFRLQACKMNRWWYGETPSLHFHKSKYRLELRPRNRTNHIRPPSSALLPTWEMTDLSWSVNVWCPWSS